jgi:type I restriction enzyme S subunit
MSEASTSDPCNLRKWPDDWKQISLRWLSKRYTGGTPNTGNPEYWSDGSIPWLNSGAVNQGTITEPSAYITEVGLRESSAKWIPTGSVVMALAGQGKTKATVGYVAIPTTGNQSLAAIVPEKIDGRFLFWWLSSRYRWLRHQSSQDGRDGINLEMIGSISCPLPPLDTQKRIARYLDEKTARIDALIAKKRELLERLAEKRQALITHAVTKGLNPDAPMKPSGIDWLGEIPAHWEVKRLKMLTEEPLRYGANASAEFDSLGWPRFVRITDIDELGHLRDDTFRSLPPEVAHNFLLEDNDILLARSGATVGKSFIYDESWGIACFAGYLIRARVRKQYIAKYVYCFLNSMPYWEWVRSNLIQSTIQNVSAERYENIPIPVPPTNGEQLNVVTFVNEHLHNIDTQCAAVNKSIDTLAEYRAALITAAVTGQIAELN